MKKIFYEKVGRKYVPVYEYDQTLMDAFPKGTHIVMCYPGGQSTRYNVNPNYAAMIAAGRLAEDEISKKLMEASEIRMQRKDRDRELTPKQRAAWNKLIKEFGDSASQLEWASTREIAEAGVNAMQAEAEKLMQHESVRKAYDHFQLMCELVKEHGKTT
jgi:t-SNARE complex subunit (syntaxin)